MRTTGTMRTGPSRVYLRLLEGKINSARYAAIIKRAYRIRKRGENP